MNVLIREGVSVQVRVAYALDLDHGAVGGGQHGVALLRHVALGITEELQYEASRATQ